MIGPAIRCDELAERREIEVPRIALPELGSCVRCGVGDLWNDRQNQYQCSINYCLRILNIEVEK